jgi:antirestriction protein ArdC
MATTATPTKTDELLRRLADGVDNLTRSDEWLQYLDVQRRFYHYSFGNCILIALQRPDATRVAGFHRWLELGRHVRKGEKGIAILAPIVRRLKVEDEDGEERTIVSSPRAFRAVHVFDISQTDGDDLHDAPVHKLEGEDPDQLYSRLRDTASSIGFTVEEDYLDGPNGDCNHELHRIRVEVRNDPRQQVKTLAHELAHAILHGDREGMTPERAELEAESVAYVVCADLGFDSSTYSLGYLATWTHGGKDVHRAISESGQRIQTAVRTILEGLRDGVEDLAA